MRVVKESDDILIVEHRPTWMWAFCGVFFLGGLFYAWKVATGQSNDYFGLLVTLSMPAGLALWGAPISRLRLDKARERVDLVHKRPFGLSTKRRFALDDLKGVELARIKNGGSGGHRVLLRLGDENVGLTIGASPSYRTDAVAKLVSRIQGFAKVGPLPQ